jgi:hypothetical protein
MALQFGHNVTVEYARVFIQILYFIKTRFYGQEMALVFKEKHVVP